MSASHKSAIGHNLLQLQYVKMGTLKFSTLTVYTVRTFQVWKNILTTITIDMCVFTSYCTSTMG